ncbi:MAG: ATPase, T2SS/T4P/T4SS family, partial [bacterium]
MSELHRQGKIIVVCSAKGGSGVSVLTAAIALQFARDPNLKVALMDYDLPCAGDSLFYVGKLGDTKIRDLPSIDKKGTAEAMVASIPVLPSGLMILPVTLRPAGAEKLPEEKLGKMLDIMRRHLDYVFVDIGCEPNDHVQEFMDRASLIIVLATPDRLSLYQTKRYLEYIEGMGLPKHFVRLVLNKMGERFPLDVRKVEQEFGGRTVWSELPYDAKIETLVLRDGALQEQFPQSPTTIAMARLSQSIAFEQVKLERGDYHGIRQIQGKGVSEGSTIMATARMSGTQTALGASNPSITMEMGATDTTELRERVHKKLIREMEEEMRRQGKDMDPDELVAKVRASVAAILDDDPDGRKLIPRFRTTVVEEIIKEALGLGCLEEALADNTITEIFVNRYDKIYVEKKGKVIATDFRFTSEQQLRNIIDRIVAPIGRRCDERMPLVDARLKDGSRVNAVIPPLAIDGSNITIRKFSKDPLTVADLVGFGAFTNQMAQFMDACVKSRKNILVSGGTGSGKTTLLNLLSSFIPEDERIITVEDVAELKLRQPHVVRLETRPPSIEGTGEITIRDLVKNCLRMRPDRIVVGECRSGEALDMLQAMNTGHDGSLTTVHANTPRDALSRLETMCLMSGIDLPARAIREQIASAIQIVVQQARLSDGSRKVIAISELTGYQNDIFS